MRLSSSSLDSKYFVSWELCSVPSLSLVCLIPRPSMACLGPLLYAWTSLLVLLGSLLSFTIYLPTCSPVVSTPCFRFQLLISTFVTAESSMCGDAAALLSEAALLLLMLLTMIYSPESRSSGLWLESPVKVYLEFFVGVEQEFL